MAATNSAERRTGLSGHPPGLAVLVSLKVWELFSYQGMRAFLVFYLISAFSLPDARASILFGSYAALVLATSVAGGIVADRWLGQFEPTMTGAVVIMGGHLVLAIQDLLVQTGALGGDSVFQLFCLGLGMIAVGTGLLKPNVLNLVGGLYRRDDPRRETGYYLYYLGVNVGSFLAPLICGRLAQSYGWGWAFSAAAIGMAVGLIVLVAGRRHVVRADGDRTALAGRAHPPRVRIYGAVAISVVLASFLIQHGLLLGALLGATLAAGCIYLAVMAARDRSGGDRRAVFRLFAVLPVPILFVVVFEQFSLAINLFSDRLVDREILGLTVAAPQLISLNPLFVFALLPMLGVLWARLRTIGREPTMAAKFTIGFVCMAAGFALLVGAVHLHAPGTRIDLGWVVAAYFCITLGELMIAPLSYALVGRTVPAHLEGIAMGLLLLCFALGNLLAGFLATLAAIPAGAAAAEIAPVYGRYFLVVSVIAGSAGLASLLLRSMLARRS